MKNPQQLKELAAQVHALKVLKRETGFQTRRTQVALLGELSNDELIEVAKIVAAMSAQGETDNAIPSRQ